MSLIYTKEKLGDTFYKVTTIIDEVEHTFNCIVAKDTEADLDELVQWNIDNLNAPPVIYQPTYADKRKAEYPPIENYIDGVVKGDQTQIDNYITECLAVKAKYPKP
jgi:predicted PolB exonuclease-like 3'-5' exonuclease